MPSTPGTVSKILWHFTGGPRWNEDENKQEAELKPEKTAYDLLCKILTSGELRLGNYKEVVHMEKILSEQTGPGTLIIDPRRKVPAVIESSSVNCVADIPIPHLNYHARRYGRMAIGFHRQSIIRHGFNPVFYHIVGSELLERFHYLIDGIAFIHRARRSENEAFPGGKRPVTAHVRDQSGNWAPSEDDILRSIEALKSNINDIIAFVKSFKPDQIDSIYCEREWRSTKPFKFVHDDLSMVAVPRHGTDGTDYFARLTDEAESLGLPKTVPIVPWEDLVEN